MVSDQSHHCFRVCLELVTMHLLLVHTQKSTPAGMLFFCLIFVNPHAIVWKCTIKSKLANNDDTGAKKQSDNAGSKTWMEIKWNHRRNSWSLDCWLKVIVLVAQLCPTLGDPMDYSPSGSSVHGILQARVLEWVANPFSRGSSWPRYWTWVFCIAGRFFTIWATGEAHSKLSDFKL